MGKVGDPFYASKPWRRLRAIVLREEPTCRECGAPSYIAAHIHSRRDRPSLELKRGNIRGLCKPCHDSETATLDHAFGNPRSTKLRGCDVNGNPLDPRRQWGVGGAPTRRGGVAREVDIDLLGLGSLAVAV